MPRSLAFLCLALLGLTSSACVNETETTYTDVGSACVSGDADAPHSVDVDFHVCMSSSCDSVVESMCEVTLEGTLLTINASATVASKGGACTADCGQLLVTCETPALAAGSYEFVYGDMPPVTLTVPAAMAGEPTCVGEPEP